MKKTVSIILMTILILMLFGSNAEQENTEEKTILTPSLVQILLRYPDQEEEKADGQVTYIYENVPEASFEEYGLLLDAYGAFVTESSNKDSILVAVVQIEGSEFYVQYIGRSERVTIIYPDGIRDGVIQTAKEITEKLSALVDEGKIDEANAVYDEIPLKEKYTPAVELITSARNQAQEQIQIPEQTQLPVQTQENEKKEEVKVQKPWIGMSLGVPDSDQFGNANIPVGAYVLSVTKTSPADQAGIQPGDIVVEFNGIEIKQQEDLINATSGLQIGQEISIRVWRPNQVMDAEQYLISAVGKYLDVIELTVGIRE